MQTIVTTKPAEINDSELYTQNCSAYVNPTGLNTYNKVSCIKCDWNAQSDLLNVCLIVLTVF